MSERQPGPVENPAVQKERELEWRRRTIELNQKEYDALVVAVQKFLSTGEPLSLEVLDKGAAASRFLEYNDEQGHFSFDDSEYKEKKRLGLYGDRVSTHIDRVSPKFAETLRQATYGARFMRGSHGDTSLTVPLALRREIQGAEIQQLRDVAEFYNKRILGDPRQSYEDLDPEIENLRSAGWERIREVQKKADPYISADTEVSTRHVDEYEKIRREFLRAGDDKRVHMVGVHAHEMTSHILTKTHADEFAERLTYFQEHPEESVDLDRRNSFVRLAGEIDKELVKEHPYRD